LEEFLKERFFQAVGESGALTLYDDPQTLHGMLINHLTAEFGVLMKDVKTGVEIEEWQKKPNRENHWQDCLGMAAAAASFEGVRLAAQQGQKVEKKKRNASAMPRCKAGKRWKGRRTISLPFCLPTSKIICAKRLKPKWPAKSPMN
jgi:phage terminase large subunit GpA-like protein